MTVEEVALTVGNRPGSLQKVAQVLAEGRLNVASLSLTSQGQKSYLRLVVGDTQRALWLLRKAGYKVDANDLVVVHVEDKAGSFLKVLDILARHRVNVLSASILVTREGQKVLVGLSVSNPTRARQLLSASGFLSGGAEGLLLTNRDLVSGPVTDGSTESVGFFL